MEKTITTALLVIASIVATVALINAVIPAAGKGTGALLTANSAATDRIKTDIEIIFASGSTGDNKIIFWAKNIGSTTINPIRDSDIFLKTPSTITRIPYTADAPSNPRWDYTIENGTEWGQSVTVKVTLYLNSVSTGLHRVNMASYNAVSAEKEFSI